MDVEFDWIFSIGSIKTLVLGKKIKRIRERVTDRVINTDQFADHFKFA